MFCIDLQGHGRGPTWAPIHNVDPEGEFFVGDGRKIWRDEAGFYHVTPQEWDSLRHMRGVTFIAEDTDVMGWTAPPPT